MVNNMVACSGASTVLIAFVPLILSRLGYVGATTCHEIKRSQDLHKALAEIGNWEALCANLEVEEATLDVLKFTGLEAEQKKQRCLQAFYQQSTVCWETVIKVLTEYPFFKGKLAKQIAKEHNVEWTFDKPQGEEQPEKPSSTKNTPEDQPQGHPPTPNKDVLEFGNFVREAVIALDKVLTGESGEINVHGRRIKFKAKWRIHSFDEPIVWDATAQDMETGIRVEAKHSDTDKDANIFAVKKLGEALRERGILHDAHARNEL